MSLLLLKDGLSVRSATERVPRRGVGSESIGGDPGFSSVSARDSFLTSACSFICQSAWDETT